MNQVITTTSSELTQSFAKDFTRSILAERDKDTPCMPILLFGDLGAGKTTFMQGFAEGLGITHPIISPTFVIMREYEIPLSSRTIGAKARSLANEVQTSAVIDLSEKDEISRFARNDIMKLYHLDLYRISSEKDLEGLGLQEILEDKNAIVAIEWPEKLGNQTSEKRIEIHFKTLSENEREITIERF